jgi:ABC-type lipoprotein export system ATPase subunit
MIKVEALSKTLRSGANSWQLGPIDLEIKSGEKIAILGRSGSGKSTLLHLLGSLLRLDSGQIEIAGEMISSMNSNRLEQFRSRKIGFIFQNFHLLPEFTLLENVTLPLLIQGFELKSARLRASETLEKVGLEERFEHYPGQISGGQRQRVAIARALVTKPQLLLADEPTGNLDLITGKKIINLLLDLQQVEQATLVLATHDSELTKAADRVIAIENGKLVKSVSGLVAA